MRLVRSSVVFLDRDGVINSLVARDGGYYSPRSISDFRLYPSTPWLIESLIDCGCRPVVVTNQPDISRGLLSWRELNIMNSVLISMGISDILVCPHDDDDLCLCRKPKAGLMKEYLRSQVAQKVWMVGDRQVDIDAGTAIGALTIQLQSEATECQHSLGADFVSKSHLELVQVISRHCS